MSDSTNSYVYTALQLQRANRMHVRSRGIEGQVKGSLQQRTVEDEVELLPTSPPRQLKLSEF
jgi:hypothetical protein